MFPTQIGNTILPKLTGKLFRVKVPTLATLTAIDYHFGIRLNHYVDEFGRAGNDKNKNQEWSTVLLNLERIIEIYEEGFPVHMLNMDDLMIVYEELDNYVKSMGSLVKNSPNGQALFDKRIYVIEKFVNEMFGNNKGSILRKSYNVAVLGNNIKMETISRDRVKDALTNISIPKVRKPINNHPFEHPTPEQRELSKGGQNPSNNVLPQRDPYEQIYNSIPTFSRHHTSIFNK